MNDEPITKPQGRRLTPKVVGWLDRIIEETWDIHVKDCRAHPSDDHIFHVIRKLDDWLNGFPHPRMFTHDS